MTDVATPNDGHLASVRDLVVRFRSRGTVVHAVNGVSFDLDHGETLGIVGESGSGKSVTSLALMRLLPRGGAVEGGRILFEGLDLLTLSDRQMRELRGSEIAMVFQDPMTSLNPVLTIRTQLVETIVAHRKVTPVEADRTAASLLDIVGIPRPESALSAYPHVLSGGMRQRVMIAMALALSPKLLIADEPTTALDVTIQAQVLELIAELSRKSNTAVILITHDLGVVAGVTKRVAVMYAGYVVETATTRDLFERPRHPYTVGLLHSIPSLDADESVPLISIEGTPPDQRTKPSGCPFAPRCAWRLPVCLTVNPPLLPARPTEGLVTTGPGATHLVACHNPPTESEARSGRPAQARPEPYSREVPSQPMPTSA